MRKARITKAAEYDLVYKKGRTWGHNLLVMKAVLNELEVSRYGFSVSRRVGGAVERNLVKRRLREIIRKESLKSGRDIVFIARPGAAQASFGDLEGAVITLLSRASLLAKKHENDCPGAN